MSQPKREPKNHALHTNQTALILQKEMKMKSRSLIMKNFGCMTLVKIRKSDGKQLKCVGCIIMEDKRDTMTAVELMSLSGDQGTGTLMAIHWQLAFFYMFCQVLRRAKFL